MLGQFLSEELELEPEPELELAPDPDVLDDPDVPELLDEGAVAVEEPDEAEVPLFELVPLLPVPELDPVELMVAAFATNAPPTTSPAVRAPTPSVVRRRIFIGVVCPFLSCHHPFGWV
jgi:hypothetical protein